MKIAFFWTGVTPAMAPCWRELAARPGIRLVLFLELPRRPDSAFDQATVLEGIECRVRYADEPLDPSALNTEIAALELDAVVILGWRSRMCRAAAESAALASVPKFFAFDMAFAWSVRKVFAPIVLRGYLRRFRAAIVPGEWSAAYARHLGFPESRIERGLLGLDTVTRAEAAHARRALPAYPRRFLFCGRYAREKRIDVLVAAYRRYRARVHDPWGLTCCGAGPEAARLRGVEGIDDRGFVPPVLMHALLASHGASVLASDYDPWPLVIAEAVAAGMPVVCTSACGSAVELVRSYFNGRVVGSGDVGGLAEAMEWVHVHESDLQSMGERGMPLTAPYAKEVWADRITAICRRHGDRPATGVDPP